MSFLEPPSFLEPAEYDSEAVHEIEPTAEQKLTLLMDRWRTGKSLAKSD